MPDRGICAHEPGMDLFFVKEKKEKFEKFAQRTFVKISCLEKCRVDKGGTKVIGAFHAYDDRAGVGKDEPSGVRHRVFEEFDTRHAELRDA